MTAKQTPLPDLLDGVPEDIVLGIPGDEPVFPSYTNIPIGKLARQAAAELRRLSAENEMLWKEREEPHKTIDMYVRECNRLESERDEARRTVREAHEAGTRLTAQRDVLLEFAKYVEAIDPSNPAPLFERARAAIKAVEENT